LEFNVPFQHKYGYIRDDGARVGSHLALSLHSSNYLDELLQWIAVNIVINVILVILLL